MTLLVPTDVLARRCKISQLGHAIPIQDGQLLGKYSFWTRSEVIGVRLLSCAGPHGAFGDHCFLMHNGDGRVFGHLGSHPAAGGSHPHRVASRELGCG